MRRWLAGLCLGIFFANSSVATEIDSFYGVWFPIDNPGMCVDLLHGEGPHIIIDHNYFETGVGAPCEEARTFLKANRLRVTAACRGENGYASILSEYALTKRGTLAETGVDGEYTRCTVSRWNKPERRLPQFLEGVRAAKMVVQFRVRQPSLSKPNASRHHHYYSGLDGLKFNAKQVCRNRHSAKRMWQCIEGIDRQFEEIALRSGFASFRKFEEFAFLVWSALQKIRLGGSHWAEASRSFQRAVAPHYKELHPALGAVWKPKS